MLKRFTAFISAVAVATVSFASLAFADDKTKEAYAILGDKVQSYGLDAKSGPDNNYPYKVVEKDGKKGWYMTASRNKNSAVYVDLDRNFAYNISDYSSYEVTVEYFDEGNGHFRIIYDGMNTPWKDSADRLSYEIQKSEIVKLDNTNTWTSHTFILENPKFKNGYNNADFAVTLHEEAMGISLAGVTFGKISVRPADTKSLVQSKMSTGAVGNNFFSGESVKVNLDIYNLSGETQKVTAEFVSYDYSGNQAYTGSCEVEISKKGKVRETLEFTPDKFSIYTAYMTITGEGIYSTSKMEYAYIKATEKNNPRLGVNNHMYRIMTRNPDKLIPIMDKTGFYGNREGIWWQYYEAKKGEYILPDRATHTHNLMETHNIDQMLILQSGNSLYGKGLPVGEEYEAAFIEYVRALVTELKGQVDCYELLNEVSSTQQEGADAKWYVRLAKTTYKVIKEIDPDIKVVIACTAGTPLDWIKEVAEGTKGCFDEFSIHPYGMKTSPEVSGRYSAILSVREILDACGAEGIPINVSEMGWSTGWVDFEHQAAFNTQIYAISSEPELGVSTTYLYDFQDDGYMPEDQENNFGLIRTWDTVDTPYLAKPSLLSLSFLNHTLANAEFVDSRIDDRYSIYRYKSDEGEDVILMWAKGENDYVTMSLGNDDVKVYDMYGNECDIWRKDGKYSFCLDYRPVYLIGNFDDFEISDAIFDISETIFEMPYDDTAEITVVKSIDEEAQVELIIPEDAPVTMVENTGFVGNKATIRFNAKGIVGKSDTIRLVIKSKDGKVFIDEEIIVKYSDKLSVNFYTELYGDGNLNRWVGVINIKNHNHEDAVSGTIKFNAPEEFLKKMKDIKIDKIEPGEEKKIVFNMPEVKYCGSYFVNIDFLEDNGYKQNFELYTDCCVALYAEDKPVIDGVVSRDEWKNDIHLMILEGREYVDKPNIGTYDGNEDLSADVIFEWDEENLYMLAKVTDDIFHVESVGSGIWKDDSIQIGLSYGGIANPDLDLFTEIGFALTSDGPLIQRYSNEEGATGITEKGQVAITRVGTTTTYEVCMPWSELIIDNTVLAGGSAVRFNMIVNDNDGNGRWGWIEYGEGIGLEKDGSLFGRIRLLDDRKN